MMPVLAGLLQQLIMIFKVMVPRGLATLLGFGVFILLQQVVVCENHGCASEGILMNTFRVR